MSIIRQLIPPLNSPNSPLNPLSSWNPRQSPEEPPTSLQSSKRLRHPALTDPQNRPSATQAAHTITLKTIKLHKIHNRDCSRHLQSAIFAMEMVACRKWSCKASWTVIKATLVEITRQGQMKKYSARARNRSSKWTINMLLEIIKCWIQVPRVVWIRAIRPC